MLHRESGTSDMPSKIPPRQKRTQRHVCRIGLRLSLRLSSVAVAAPAPAPAAPVVAVVAVVDVIAGGWLAAGWRRLVLVVLLSSP